MTVTDLCEPVATATWASSIRTPRAFESILGQFERALASSELRAGDRLPPERDLVERFGASRTSVREALRVLETFGVIEVRRGAEGAWLCREPRAAFAELMRFHLALGHYRAAEVVEVRSLLEANAVTAVATAGDRELLSRLRALSTAMAAEGLAVDEFHRLDVEFHDALVAGGGNELAALLHRSCRALIHQAMRDALAGEWTEVRAELAAEHAAICAALEAGDAAAASRLLSEHVARWGARATAADSSCA